MKKTILTLALIAVTVFSVLEYQWGINGVYSKVKNFTASVFFVDSVTGDSLRDVYANANKKGGRKIKILVVPGHDQRYFGTEFNGLKEVEMTIALGEELHRLLAKDKKIEAYITQTKDGYVPELNDYFENKKDEVLAFISEQKEQMKFYASTGEIKVLPASSNKSAPSLAAYRLYAINKWANSKGMDIIIHIHFNDYEGRKKGHPGAYSGFSIYTPEKQYSNAKGSRALADAIHARLGESFSKSNIGKERSGIVEDQELIAVGANNTLDGAGILIEYGYIYEPSFADPVVRKAVLDTMALKTYEGIMDFFKEVNRNERIF
ncbi:MAG TPA: N-acetylmuramoyl-L-alanine amidase [Candidatus Paceibacterota bacterium]|nr:N-acetylmuramoyl-L-alanine amidase [Candidatus Paceibacterota bacterium]